MPRIHIGLADRIGSGAAGVGDAGQDGRNGAGQVGGKECVGNRNIGQRNGAGILHRQRKAHQIARSGKRPIGSFAEHKTGSPGRTGHRNRIRYIRCTGGRGRGAVQNTAGIDIGLRHGADPGAGPVDRTGGQGWDRAGKAKCGVVNRDIGQGQIAGIAHLECISDQVAHSAERCDRRLLVQGHRFGGRGRVDRDRDGIGPVDRGPVRGGAHRAGGVADRAQVQIGLSDHIGAAAGGHAKRRDIGPGARQRRDTRIGHHHPGQGLRRLIGNAEPISDGLAQGAKTGRAGLVEQKSRGNCRWHGDRRRGRGDHSRPAGPGIGKAGCRRIGEPARVNIGLSQPRKAGSALKAAWRQA